jgi:hypothetical protein
MDPMKNYRQLLKELPSNKVVFAFGRFQPPTVEHELQVKMVKKLAEEQRADHVIYASKDLKEDLLPADKKVQYMNLMFPNTNIKTTEATNIVEAAKELNKKYKNLIMVTSADCKEEYERILNKKNGSEIYFETIEVIAAGNKDPEINKLCESAKKGDYVRFRSGLPSQLRELDSRRLMNDIRIGLGLDMVKEDIKVVKNKLREQYFRKEIFNVGDIVESEGTQYEIVKRGANHLLLQEESGELVSKWIQDVTVVKEGILQPTGSDALDVVSDTPAVNPVSKYNIAKDRLRYKDFKKLNAMNLGEASALEKFRADAAERQKKHDEIEARRKAAAEKGEENMSSAIDRLHKQVTNESRNDADKHWDIAQTHKEKAVASKNDEEAYHSYMSAHHDSMSTYHGELGQHSEAERHSEKAEKHHEKSLQSSEKGLAEAHKLGDKVIIHKGPKDVLGKVGHVGEIRKRWAGDTKTYTIDHEGGSIQLKPTHFKTFKEEKELEEAKKKVKKETKDDFKPTAINVKLANDDQQVGVNNAHGFDAFFNQ